MMAKRVILFFGRRTERLSVRGRLFVQVGSLLRVDRRSVPMLMVLQGKIGDLCLLKIHSLDR